MLYNIIKFKPDLIHCHDPELIFLGLICKISGIRVIYDVHEDLPVQIMSKSWLPRLLRYPISKLSIIIEYIAGYWFDAILTATPIIAERFPISKTEVIHNYPIISEFSDKCKESNNKDKSFIYVGGLTKERGIEEILLAAESINSKQSTKINVILAGRFSNELFKKNMEKYINSAFVFYKGWLSREDIVSSLNNSIAGLVVLHPIQNYIESLPTKMFEYMAAGIPIIASNFPIMKEIVESERCGLVVNPLSSQDLEKAILWIMNNPIESKIMGENGRQAIFQKYNWLIEARKLTDIYQSLLY